MNKIISANDNLFFDNVERASNGDPIANAKIKVALQAFLDEPKVIKSKKLQGFGVSTDLAQLTADAFNVNIQQDNFDLGYEQAFRKIALGQGQDFWEIYEAGNSLTFMRVEEGQRIEQAGITGSKVTAYVDYYGGAIGWTDKMIRFRKVSSMIDLALVFRNKFYANKADNHYALLNTAGALNVTPFDATGASDAEDVIKTINSAMYALGNRNRNKGYGDTATAPMVIYASPADEARIEGAFRSLTNNTITGLSTVISGLRNVQRIYTFNSNIAVNHPIICLPGNKIQMAEALPPTTYNSSIDPLTLNNYQAVWSIYGAVVADTDQVQRFDLV